MINNILKVVLAIACIFVGYLIYNTISTTVRYEQRVKDIESDIIVRLTDIKEAQFAYRDAYGKFASNFDSLLYGIKNGRIAEVKQVGELVEGADNTIQRDTFYVAIADKLKGRVVNDFDSLPYVPHTNKVMFQLQSGEITRNGVPIQVFEAQDTMPFNKKRGLKIGSMSDAIYTGNWEKQE